MIDIFQYVKTSTILKDRYEDKKRANPSFSIRSWANQMGLKSHGSLQQILADKRTLPKKYVPALSKSLDFTNDELIYFETLVDFEKSKTQEERELYYNRLSRLRPNNKEVSILEVENYKYLENPLHAIIRTMMDRKDFSSNPSWIKKQLRVQTTELEIKEVLKRLEGLELVQNKSGKLIKTKSQVRNKLDTPSKAVQEHHKKISTIAAEQISLQDVAEREFNTYCLNMDKRNMPQAKERIRSFIKDFMNEFELETNEYTETYNLNLQLFSLTECEEQK